jgi:sporulation protein YlmC with PRC-barrel domain
MRRFAVLLAIGALLSAGLQPASYGQLQQFFEQYQQPEQRVDRFVGSTVYGRGGENLGTLSQVLIDPQTGQPLYGVIRSGGIFGFGAVEYPIPWQLFAVTRSGLRIDMTESRLRDAPRYTAGDQPDLNHPRWQRRISNFYGVQPYGGGQGYGGSRGDPGQGTYLYQDIFNPNVSQRFSGTVERVHHRTQGDVTQVLLRTDDGRRIMVSLAPDWYLRSHGAEPRRGDSLIVRGSLVSTQGREFLIATMMRMENQRLRLRSNDGVPTWLEQQQHQPDRRDWHRDRNYWQQ